MNEPLDLADSLYEEQMQLASRELSSFIAAVTALYGQEQPEKSAQDWLEESVLADNAHRSQERDWRVVTIAAETRLANRLNAMHASADAAVAPCISA